MLAPNVNLRTHGRHPGRGRRVLRANDARALAEASRPSRPGGRRRHGGRPRAPRRRVRRRSSPTCACRMVSASMSCTRRRRTAPMRTSSCSRPIRPGSRPRRPCGSARSTISRRGRSPRDSSGGSTARSRSRPRAGASDSPPPRRIPLPPASPEGEHRYLTVLFADMRGSTELLGGPRPRRGERDPRRRDRAIDGRRARGRRHREPGDG